MAKLTTNQQAAQDQALAEFSATYQFCTLEVMAQRMTGREMHERIAAARRTRDVAIRDAGIQSGASRYRRGLGQKTAAGAA